MKIYTHQRVLGAETILSGENEGVSLPFRVITKRWGDSQPWQAMVLLTPQATPSERKAAFAFNLNCLSKLGGCKDSKDLLPSAWRANKPVARSVPRCGTPSPCKGEG